MVTWCWDWGRSRNTTTLCSLCTHIKFASTHTDCKCNVSVFEAEPEFLDPKAVTVPVSSPPWPPAPYGQRFSQVAHVWQEPFMSTAVAPQLQAAPGSPQFGWELESSRYSGFVPHGGWLSSSCCLGPDISEIPTELVFRLHRSCESHLTSLPHPGEFHQALGQRRIYYD